MKNDELPAMPGIKDVARYCGISESLVRRLMKTGPTKRGSIDLRKADPILVGGVWRFDRQKLLKMLRGE